MNVVFQDNVLRMRHVVFCMYDWMFCKIVNKYFRKDIFGTQ